MEAATGPASWQRPCAPERLLAELRRQGLAAQLSRRAVWLPGVGACWCANVHALLRSRRGDGLEALALLTPVAFSPPLTSDPATQVGAGLWGAGRRGQGAVAPV